MRKYRMGLIQTPDQLRFSYMTIIEGAKFIKGDSSIQVNRVSSVLLSSNCSPCKPWGLSLPSEKCVYIKRWVQLASEMEKPVPTSSCAPQPLVKSCLSLRSPAGNMVSLKNVEVSCRRESEHLIIEITGKIRYFWPIKTWPGVTQECLVCK